MLKIVTREYVEGGLAIKSTIISVFNVPLFKHIRTSTNEDIIELLTLNEKEITKIEGFRKYETEN